MEALRKYRVSVSWSWGYGEVSEWAHGPVLAATETEAAFLAAREFYRMVRPGLRLGQEPRVASVSVEEL